MTSPTTEHDDLARLIAETWAEVLGIATVDRGQGFFTDLGGTSLTAARVLALLRKRTHHRVRLDAVLRNPTPELLAAELAGNAVTRDAPPATTQAGPSPVLLPGQHWFYRSVTQERQNFTIETLLRLPAETDPDRLDRAVTQLMSRHQALRSQIRYTDGTWTTALMPGAGVVRLVHTPVHDGGDPVDQVNDEAFLARAWLEPADGRVFAVTHLTGPPTGADFLLLVVHHSVCDGFGFSILVDDLRRLFSAADGKDPHPAPLGALWWAERLATYARSAESLPERKFWREQQPPGASPLLRPTPVSAGGAVEIAQRLTQRESTGLETAAERHAVSVNALILACVTESYAPATGREGLVISSTYHGRDVTFDGQSCAESVGYFSYAVPHVISRAKGGIAKTARQIVRETSGLPMRGVGNLLFAYGQSDDAEAERACLLLRERTVITVNFRADIELAEPGSLWPEAELQPGLPPQVPRSSRLRLMVNRNEAGALWFSWSVNRDYFLPQSTDLLLTGFHEVIRQVARSGGA